MPTDQLHKDILASRVYDVARHTPLDEATQLSRRLGNAVLLKREDLQPVRSYKGRGAANLIAQLDSEQIWAGVVCASAGNHAQGVAHACATLGVNARIYLPARTPRQKLCPACHARLSSSTSAITSPVSLMR